MAIRVLGQVSLDWHPEMRYMNTTIKDGHWWDSWYLILNDGEVMVYIACEVHQEYYTQHLAGVKAVGDNPSLSSIVVRAI